MAFGRYVDFTGLALSDLVRLVGFRLRGSEGRRARLLATDAELDDRQVLDALMAWLVRSFEVRPGGGCAAYYCFFRGWGNDYPETTGYIANTFIDYGTRIDDSSYLEMARAMLDWEVDVQMDGGGVAASAPGPHEERRAKVFNTSQVMLGWVQGFEVFEDPAYLQAATRAGDWLCDGQDANGEWRQLTHNGLSHTANSRTAWALLRLAQHTRDERHQDAAVRHLQWVLSNQQDNGYFLHANTLVGKLPHTHGIAYTLEGLFEAGRILEDPQYAAAVARTLEAIQGQVQSQGWLAAFLEESWGYRSFYSCLTGNAQLARLFFEMADATGADAMRSAGTTLVGFNKHVMRMKHSNAGVEGGISGSFPIFGRYAPLRFPNWAPKFLADALMTKMGWYRGS